MTTVTGPAIAAFAPVPVETTSSPTAMVMPEQLSIEGSVILRKPNAAINVKPEEHPIILGDVKALEGPGILKTLLGSCVSACLFDPETGIGGMNHFSLPGVGEAGGGARYGGYAMELLVTAMMKLGGDRTRFKAKIFGGAKVLDMASEKLNVGAKNSAFVEEYLKAEGIEIVGRSLGGTRGLLVRFEPSTGRAQIKPLSDHQRTAVVRDEKVYEEALVKKVSEPLSGDIELF